VDPGFNPGGVLTMRLALTQAAYPDNQSLTSFWSRLQERVSILPGVESTALAFGLPPLRPINANDTEIEGLAQGPDMPIQNVDYWQTVTPDYFKTLRIRLIEGRFLEERDGAGAPPAVVINQAMAMHFYGNQSPIGRRVRSGTQDPWRTIVGVVADVKNAGLDKPAGTELFMPAGQIPPFGFGLRNFYLVLRTSGDPASMTRSATEAIHSLDSSLPVANVRTMDDVLVSAESRPRFLTLLLGLFSALALALAAVGIYGLMAYSVTERTHEIGIRMALGARRGDVLRMIFGYGTRLIVAGLAIGLGGAIGLTRLMTSLLFGVTATDPTTFAGVAVVLAAVALSACYVPARRATKVDPMVALRYE
jgi:predicted permease